jgi:hypothetical protein
LEGLGFVFACFELLLETLDFFGSFFLRRKLGF